jgi:hypothetical protein
MNFTKVDPAIRAWSSRSRVPLATHYQDAEVRSFELVGHAGRAQIWIEVDGDVATAYAWDYRKQKRSFAADASTLEAALDKALQVARGWCGSNQLAAEQQATEEVPSVSDSTS